MAVPDTIGDVIGLAKHMSAMSTFVHRPSGTVVLHDMETLRAW
jgi:hypothetical protein